MAEGFIAFPGGPGTLAEVAITWNLLQREAIRSSPLILVGANWRSLLSAFGRTPWVRDRDVDLLRFVESGDEAVREILNGRV
jgi:predicted Rossmann-fold nucleotide-binding protein